MKPKIIFVHTLNNYTGSPNVLSVVIRGLIKKGYDAELISSNTPGFLSDIDGLSYTHTSYKWKKQLWKTAFLLLFSQLRIFLKVAFSSGKNTIWYLNTITPVGAAWACKITGKRFIYHVHENMQLDKPVYPVFKWTYKHCNQRSLFVSEYVKEVSENCRSGKVVHNCLDPAFLSRAAKKADTDAVSDNILMISSQRSYKGIHEFVELARRLPDYSFELVLASRNEAVDNFIRETSPPENLIVHPRQEDVHPFYSRAKILLQLSKPDEWVETFGLTILEAMVYGVPAIAPNAGGPVELVDHGKTGFHVDPSNLYAVEDHIVTLMEDQNIYSSFSDACRDRSENFDPKQFIQLVEDYLINT